MVLIPKTQATTSHTESSIHMQMAQSIDINSTQYRNNRMPVISITRTSWLLSQNYIIIKQYSTKILKWIQKPFIVICYEKQLTDNKEMNQLLNYLFIILLANAEFQRRLYTKINAIKPPYNYNIITKQRKHFSSTAEARENPLVKYLNRTMAK